MGNRRSRAARRFSGGGAPAVSQWRRQHELQRQVEAARTLMGAQGPTDARKRLRRLGLLMFTVCAVIGAGAAALVVRFWR